MLGVVAHAWEVEKYMRHEENRMTLTVSEGKVLSAEVSTKNAKCIICESNSIYHAPHVLP